MSRPLTSDELASLRPLAVGTEPTNKIVSRMLATIDYLQAELNKPRPAPEELSGDTNQQEKYRKCRMEVAKLNNEITLLKAKLTACRALCLLGLRHEWLGEYIKDKYK